MYTHALCICAFVFKNSEHVTLPHLTPLLIMAKSCLIYLSQTSGVVKAVTQAAQQNTCVRLPGLPVKV